MRVLVTGATGLLGSAVVEAAARRGHEVVGTARRGDGVLVVDLEDLAAATALVGHARADLVVHTAARTDVDACEDDETGARRLHADASETLARAAARRGSRFVHVSTDAVVPGDGTPAPEDAVPAPPNAYARTKAEGERRVLDAHPGALVVRTNFFGARRGRGRSLAEWALGELEAGRPVTGFEDVRFNPLWTGHLAEALLEAPERGARGVLHVGGGDAVTKRDFLARLARAFGLDPSLVRPGRLADRPWRARRPACTVLDVRRAETLLGRRMPDLDAGLRAFAAWRDGRSPAAAGDGRHGDR